jgi:copper homeostasis protein
MEVCVDSLESALAAFEGGATRIELCSSLNEGGLTPSSGLYKCIRKRTEPSFKIFAMIRSRSGDFLYNDNEIESMCEDIKNFVELEVDGLVFGALDENGLPDENILTEFKKLIPKKIETTFHRAFDVCSDWEYSLDMIQKLKFNRILTSGQEKTAFDGIKKIRMLAEACQFEYQNSLTIVPGCGINSANLETILIDTKCREFHASCRTMRTSKMLFKNQNVSMGNESSDEYSIQFTDCQKVKHLRAIYDDFLKKNMF